MKRNLGTILVAIASACGPTEPSLQPASQPSFAVFETGVQPILAARCANPTTCHGQPDRPLSIYARHAYRADPADVFSDPPLTDRELRSNFDRARSFATAVGDLAPLLSKPLDPAISGVDHTGGIQFYAREEYEYLEIESWIASTADDGT